MTFELSVDQVNVILQVLSKAPFDIAAPLIEAIRNQAIAQIEQQPAVSAE
jgi:hypothetical protein